MDRLHSAPRWSLWCGTAALALVAFHAGAWTLQAGWLWDSYDRLRQGASGSWTDEGATASGWLRPGLMVRKPALTVVVGSEPITWSTDTTLLTRAPSGIAMAGTAPQQVSWDNAVVATVGGIAVSPGRWSGTNLRFKAVPGMEITRWDVSWDGTVLSVTAPNIAIAGSGLAATVSGSAVLTGTTPSTWLLQNLAARWGPLVLSASARLEWNSVAQPALTGTMTVAGYGAGLDSLVSAGWIMSDAARAIRGVLDTLVAAIPTGPVRVPVELRGGILAAAGFPLLRVATPH